MKKTILIILIVIAVAGAAFAGVQALANYFAVKKS